MPLNKSTSLKNSLLIALLYCITGSVFYVAATHTPIVSEELNLVRTGLFIILIPLLGKYLTQLAALPLYSIKQYITKATNNPKVINKTVSVLIPAYNEEVGIIKTLQSVIATRYPKLEIIVINDGSTDQTHHLISEFINNTSKAGNDKPTLKYLNISNGGKSRALNQGLKLVTGEVVMTIDGDCLMDENAIVNMVKHFKNFDVAAVAGNVIIGNKRKPIEIIQQLEYLCGFFLRRADSVFNAVFIIGGAAAAYRFEVIKKLGGFNTDIVTEDIEMSLRILAAGYKTRYAADAVTYTEGPSDWQGLFSQRLRWKFGRFQTLLKYKSLFFSTQKQHSRYLTWLILPIAIYGEFILLIESLILALFYGYSIAFNDYLPLVMMIGFITMVVLLQICFDTKARFHLNLLVIAPVAWLIFYVIDIVEFQALYRSLKRLLKNENLQWQKWIRVGL